MRIFVSLTAAAGVIALAAPQIAEAATGPSATVALARHQVTAGTRPSLTYVTADRPEGSATYLEVRQAGSGHHWFEERRLGQAGTVRVPTVPAGSYQLRVVITRSGHLVAASPATRLRVTRAAPAPAQHGSSSGLMSWIGKAALMVLGYLLGG
jgi:hypothetical protein